MTGVGDLPYDPEARRDTPLAMKLKERIRRLGPLTVAQYMRACLQDPEHGYYVTQHAIGRGGDFITAPEISQVFGELIGLWCAVVWQQMGAPERFKLVELGPGRGTLMRDALRATRLVPGFLAAADVHLVETSRTLRETQRAMLAGSAQRLTWHEDELDALSHERRPSHVPTIVIANEFLDADPISQLVFNNGRWLQRAVSLDAEDRLVFTTMSPFDPEFAPLVRPAFKPKQGDVYESSGVMTEFGMFCIPSLAAQPFAALFIDYGHARSDVGDTLQAVRDHRPEHPLTSPGEADLTAQVNFEMAVCLAEIDGVSAVDGPVTQAEFLGRLGIMERASRLMSANPAKAAEIEMGVMRLMGVPGMGDRFKVIGVRSRSLPPLPGF